MKTATIPVVFILLTGLVRIRMSQAHQREDSDPHKVGLKLINEYRCWHHAEPLVFSEELSEVALDCAQQYAKLDKSSSESECPASESIDHPMDYSRSEESVYIGTDDDPSKPDGDLAKLAIETWYKESTNYDYDEDDAILKWRPIRNFTNIVWTDFKDVGLGFHRMEEDNKFVFVVLYGPPIKDYDGSRSTNVFPCKQTPCYCDEKDKKDFNGPIKIRDHAHADGEDSEKSKTSTLLGPEGVIIITIAIIIAV